MAANVLPTLEVSSTLKKDDYCLMKLPKNFEISLYIAMLLPNKHSETAYVTLCRQADHRKGVQMIDNNSIIQCCKCQKMVITILSLQLKTIHIAKVNFAGT